MLFKLVLTLSAAPGQPSCSARRSGVAVYRIGGWSARRGVKWLQVVVEKERVTRAAANKSTLERN